MRILLISDTHGRCNRVYEIYKKLTSEAPIDMIVHCGDYYTDALEIKARLGCPVTYVKGNSDGCYDPDEYRILDTEYGSVFISHGHIQEVNHNQQKLYYTALEKDCRAAFYGHTHRAVFTNIEDFYIVNPGSLSEPRDGSGGTFALIVTDEESLWGKIYRYDAFMCEDASIGERSRYELSPNEQSKEAKAEDAAHSEPVKGAEPRLKKKPKVKGGHLRDMLNYSDRF